MKFLHKRGASRLRAKRALGFAALALFIAAGFGACNKSAKDNNALTLLALSQLLNSSPKLTGTPTGNTATPGSTLNQNVQLQAGTPFSASYNVTEVTALGTRSAVVTSGSAWVEISITNQDGVEVFYARYDASTGTATVSYTPSVSGTYTISIKNNSQITLAVNRTSESGGTFEGTVEDANTLAAHGNTTFKVFTSFYNACWNSVNTVYDPAPAGTLYFRAFAAIGTVNADKTVADSSATITVSDGTNTITLRTIREDLAAANPSATAEQLDQYANMMKFMFRAWFGIAGEVYITPGDGSLGSGSCSGLNVDAANPSAANITMRLQSGSIDKTFPIRPTLAANLSSNGPTAGCNYNSTTLVPEYYDPNTTSYLPCPTISRSAPPTISATLPAPAGSLNNPTRILLTGYSYSRAFMLLGNQMATDINNGTVTTYNLDGCLYNGGMLSVPIGTSVEFPIAAFNVPDGDILSASGTTGVTTALNDFYQGQVDLSGSVTYPYYNPSSPTGYTDVTINITNCSVAADSGIAVPSLTDITSVSNGTAGDYIWLGGVIAP